MKGENAHHPVESKDQFFRHKFDNINELIKRFDSVERDEWQMPEKVIEMLNLPVNAAVAEVGSGTGYFAVRFASYLRNGKVIALDKEPKLVAYLKKRAEALGLTNVGARLVETEDDIDLGEDVEVIFSVDMYHHVPDRVSYFSKCIRQLKPDGKLVVIDRRTNSPGSQSFNRIPPEVVKKEMLQAGLKQVKDFDFLPYQYYLVFEKDETL